jgi:hypothetical protein
MSNALAIAAVTTTLKRMLKQAFDTEDITSEPLDRAAGPSSKARVNLFLYQTSLNGAYRNLDVPPPGSGTLNHPAPLALDLHYLLTPYSDESDELTEHRLLATAMRVLHDNAILSPEFIRQSTEADVQLAASDLHQQVERVRLTYQPMPLEELSKLWTAFQTPLRTSAAYVASLVLIESALPRRRPLPVLTRGEQDDGPEVAAATTPQLHGVVYKDVDSRQPALLAARIAEHGTPGEIVTLLGQGLGAARTLLVLNPHERAASTNGADRDVVARLSPLSTRGTSLRIQLDPAQDWIAGALTVAVEYHTPSGKTRRSNPLRFSVAPAPVISANGVSVLETLQGGRRLLHVNLQFPVRTAADVFLLLTNLSGGEAPPWLPAVTSLPDESRTSPAFDVTDVAPGRYRLQSSVDSVESLLMVRDDRTYRFDERLEVEL